MKPLADLLRDSATHHRRLCPRQVLGARVGMFAASLLDLDLPQSDKRLLAFVETDGCFVGWRILRNVATFMSPRELR